MFLKNFHLNTSRRTVNPQGLDVQFKVLCCKFEVSLKCNVFNIHADVAFYFIHTSCFNIKILF